MNTLKLTAFALASIIAVAHANPDHKDHKDRKILKELKKEIKEIKEIKKDKTDGQELTRRQQKDLERFENDRREAEGDLGTALANGDSEKADKIRERIAEINVNIARLIKIIKTGKDLKGQSGNGTLQPAPTNNQSN